MKVGPLWEIMPLPKMGLGQSAVDDAKLWLWKLHNIISMRIAARSVNDTEASQLEKSLFLSKRVWPPALRYACTRSEKETEMELPTMDCILHVAAYKSKVCVCVCVYIYLHSSQ